jgi:hypothetical protein
MVVPELGEPLLLYIATITDTVSMVLVAERPEPRQHQEPEAEEAPGSQPQEANSGPHQPRSNRVLAPGSLFGLWGLGAPEA